MNYAWASDKYEQMEYDLKIRDSKLEEKLKELDQALKERDDFKDKLEKWSNASVLQNEVLNKQRYVSDKAIREEDLKGLCIFDSGCSGVRQEDKDKLYDVFLKLVSWRWVCWCIGNRLCEKEEETSGKVGCSFLGLTRKETSDMLHGSDCGSRKQGWLAHKVSNIHAPDKPSEERTANKEIPLSSEEQALHDELVNLMHQESLAKLHNDAQRTALKEDTWQYTTDSDDDIPKDGVFSTNSFDDMKDGFEKRCTEDTAFNSMLQAQRARCTKGTDKSECVDYACKCLHQLRELKQSDRLLLAFALSMGLYCLIRWMLKRAFFDYWHTSHRRANVKQPPGLEDHAHTKQKKVYRVVKALYGCIKPQEHG
ncbi:hypothetical protein Tco_0066366 [Tanacetum coccineum]